MVNLEMGGVARLGGVAGENGDGEAVVAVKGGENGRAEIATCAD